MLSFRKILGFNDWWLMIAGIPVASLIITSILFNEVLRDFSSQIFSRCILVSMVYTTIYWIVFRAVFVFVRYWFPGPEKTGQRIGVQIVFILVTYFGLKAFLKDTISEQLHAFSGTISHPDTAIEPVSTLILTFLILAIYEGVYFFNLLNQSIVEKEQLQRAHIQSQLEGLKNQVNPHFLFNSLNTLAQLIPEDTEKAVRFVQKLSKSYRYILEIRDEKLICLGDELDFLKAFVFLLRERFGDNLQVEVDVPDEKLRAKVVPLSLQLLVENAIKHNIISKSRPLHISIYLENDKYLIVKNNLQLKNQVIKSTRMGLENIKQRYRFYSDELVQIKSTEAEFIVTLPLIYSEKLLLATSS